MPGGFVCFTATEVLDVGSTGGFVCFTATEVLDVGSTGGFVCFTATEVLVVGSTGGFGYFTATEVLDVCSTSSCCVLCVLSLCERCSRSWTLRAVDHLMLDDFRVVKFFMTYSVFILTFSSDVFQNNEAQRLTYFSHVSDWLEGQIVIIHSSLAHPLFLRFCFCNIQQHNTNCSLFIILLGKYILFTAISFFLSLFVVMSSTSVTLVFLGPFFI